MKPLHIIQLSNSSHGRRIGIVEEPDIILLDTTFRSTYDLLSAIINGTVDKNVDGFRSSEVLAYDDVYQSKTDWIILPPVDCPKQPMMCMLSGTGLTHKASADNRQRMHEHQKSNHLTDSMKMYLMGEEGGKPADDRVGVQPEWFYKGNGHNLKGHREPLVVPAYAEDGGEEPEIAGVYLVSNEGVPVRLGFTQANEFSDHIMEQKNYLYLAHSKIRNASIGPELVLTNNFLSLKGEVTIMRAAKKIWSKSIHTGEDAITHSLKNLEHHHFKYAQHRIPGQLHIHFFGASAFSFGENLKLLQSDEMHVSFEGMGRPLINSIHIDETKPVLYEVIHQQF